jgi:PAS domain S-box-containing protein
VLHLEDSTRDAELVESKLDVEGVACEIVRADDRPSFEAALAREAFDLVFTDYNLPGYDGIAALKQVIEKQPDAPVIIISGSLGEDEAVKCLHLGATDYLLKSHLGRLGTAVRRAVREADARRKRQHTECALVQREQSLRENETRTNFALAAAGMGVWEIEFATNQLTWSDTMAPLFGLASGQAPRTTEEYFQLVHRDDRHDVEASVGRAIAGERDYAGEFRTIWPDGSTHWVQGRAQVSYETDGTPHRLLGVAIDITVRKLLEGRLEEAQRTEVRISKEQLQAKDQFFSHVSHELRTPLAAIDWFATNLSEGLLGEMTLEQGEHLDTIVSNVKQLERMIDDFLDLSRVDAGKLSISSCQMAVASIVDEALSTCRAKTRAAALSLEAEIGPDVPLVWADPDRTRQVLINLIDNAIKFTPPGGTVSVSVQVADDPDFVCVSVADSGCGITMENRDRVFERLFQELGGLDASRKGLGLGLFISKELVTLQGGRIWVESEIGRGATFSFTVPVFSLRRILAPVLSARHLEAGTMTVITVEMSPGHETADAKDQRLRETRRVMNASVIAGQDLVLPRIFGPASPEPFFIVASTDESGADVIVRRIQEQLESAARGDVRRSPMVSTIVIEYPKPAECGLEQSITHLVNRLTDLVTPGDRGSHDGIELGKHADCP